MICSGCGNQAHMTRSWIGKDGRIHERCDVCAGVKVVARGYIGIASERMETENPQRDTMRAIEYMAKTGQCTGEQARRWTEQAKYLPDRNQALPPLESGPRITPEQQAAERDTMGAVKHLWDEAYYERAICHKEPENEIQAQNYAVVDRWEGKT